MMLFVVVGCGGVVVKFDGDNNDTAVVVVIVVFVDVDAFWWSRVMLLFS